MTRSQEALLDPALDADRPQPDPEADDLRDETVAADQIRSMVGGNARGLLTRGDG